MTTLNKKQRLWVYNTIISTERANGKAASEYGTPGTAANAILASVCAIGKAGIHIESFRGIHKGAHGTTADSRERVPNYLTWFNRQLRKAAGPKAPKLVCNMLGDKRVYWQLAPKQEDNTET
mgnify:FL=1